MTPRQSVSEPMVRQERPRRCAAASARADKRLETSGMLSGASAAPTSGYRPPQEPAHQNSASSGSSALAATLSATQALCAARLEVSAISGVVQKASSSKAQVGSSSLMNMRSRST
jgi:hypothetical protein